MGTEEFNSLFTRFKDGTASDEELSRLVYLLDNQDELFTEMSHGLWYSDTSEPMDPVIKADIRSSIMAAISKGKHRKFSLRRISISFAAAAVLAAIAFGIGFLTSKDQQAEQQFEVFALRGQQSKLTLPDGTNVWLNSDSKLSYTTGYNAINRNVNLTGEAFFEVARNAELPFVVNADGKMTVTALGTKFNVKAYSSEDKIIATLAEGSIRAQTNSGELLLKPGQNAEYSKSVGRILLTQGHDLNHLVPWRENELYLDNMTLAEVGAVLERMYNVEVIYGDEEIMKYTYTGLIRNNSLVNVLELVSGTSPIKYRIHDNVVKINHK